MSDVTDADRAKARQLAENLIDEASMAAEYPASYGEAGRDAATEAIAAALAEERRKAREPFLAMIPELKNWRIASLNTGPGGYQRSRPYEHLIGKIRRAAEESGE